MHTTTIIAATSIIFILLDSIYLYFMSSYFNNQIKIVQGSTIKLNMLADILCYISIIEKLVCNNCGYRFIVGWNIIRIDHNVCI